MTLPIQMPFSGVLRMNNPTWAHAAVAAHGDLAHVSGSSLFLPRGVNTVQIVWDGASGLTVRYYPRGGTDYRILDEFPTGTIYVRRRLMLQIPVDSENSELRFWVWKPSQEEMDNCRLGVTVVPTPA